MLGGAASGTSLQRRRRVVCAVFRQRAHTLVAVHPGLSCGGGRVRLVQHKGGGVHRESALTVTLSARLKSAGIKVTQM